MLLPEMSLIGVNSVEKFKLIDPSKKCKVDNEIKVYWHDVMHYTDQTLNEILNRLKNYKEIFPLIITRGIVVYVDQSKLTICSEDCSDPDNNAFDVTDFPANIIWDIKIMEEKQK